MVEVRSKERSEHANRYEAAPERRKAQEEALQTVGTESVRSFGCVLQLYLRSV